MRARILTEKPYLHMRESKVRSTEDDAQAAQVKPNGKKPPAAFCHWAIFCSHGIPTSRDANANNLEVRALAIYEMQNWLAHLSYALRSGDDLVKLCGSLGTLSSNSLKPLSISKPGIFS